MNGGFHQRNLEFVDFLATGIADSGLEGKIREDKASLSFRKPTNVEIDKMLQFFYGSLRVIMVVGPGWVRISPGTAQLSRDPPNES